MFIESASPSLLFCYCLKCFGPRFHLFLFCSSSGTGDEARLVVCSSLPLLCSRDAHPGLQPAPGILPLSDTGIHGRSVWSQHRVHRPVRSLVYIINFVNVDYFYAHFGLFLSQGSCRDSSPQDVYIARSTKSMRLWKPTGEGS